MGPRAYSFPNAEYRSCIGGMASPARHYLHRPLLGAAGTGGEAIAAADARSGRLVEAADASREVKRQ